MALTSSRNAKNTKGIILNKRVKDAIGEGRAENANIKPGMVVKQGTAVNQLLPDDNSGKHLGYVLENMVPKASPDLRGAFATADRISYGYGVGDEFMGIVASGQNLASEVFLKSDANGKFVAWVAGTDNEDEIVAKLIQEGGTGGALGADTHLACRWGVS